MITIAVIGTGNVGSALATAWARAGHTVRLGVQNIDSFKGKALLGNPNTTAHLVQEAVQQSDVVLVAVPAPEASNAAQALGDTTGKVVIDAMNIVMGRGPEGYANTSDAILAHTATRDVVKCFNTTGAENMAAPRYGNTQLDMFMAGDSSKGKRIARQLALDAGFAECYDIGGSDKFTLMEQFAWFWINLAIVQKQGRDIGFKLLHRSSEL